MARGDAWDRLKEIFDQVACLDEAHRGTFLSKLRENDKTLFREVSALLNADLEARDFLADPLEIDLSASLIGENIGPYRVTREIGRGGMGGVFEGVRQDGEFHQRVAIKLTNRNLFSEDLIRRFRLERQILARLEHPNIVRLFDGGLTASHVPYFVMEYIEGDPITRYCDRHSLSINQRLHLFVQVCDAVSYAHRQLIVHRDLKPSNILVTAEAKIKLLDFGIAKALDSENPAFTTGMPLTPGYASPEQIISGPISTASDVFSLGSVLYELLTGRTYLEASGKNNDLAWINDDWQPELPSAAARIQGSDHSLEFRLLKGDIDSIVLKALCRLPENRYASVDQLRNDIIAHLEGRPVSVHPPSRFYRGIKFVNRNRVAASIVSAAMLLIVLAGTTAIWQAVSASRQRAVAEQNFAQVRRLANTIINDYHDEIAKLDGSTQIREKLVSDALIYLDAISQQKTTDIGLLREIAGAYRKIGSVQGMPYMENLGHPELGSQNLRKSVDILKRAAALEPTNNELKAELVASLSDWAQVEKRVNPLCSHGIYYEALDLNKAMIEEDPTNIDQKIPWLKLRIHAADHTSNDDESRLIEYREIAAEAEGILPRRPQNIELVRILEMIFVRIDNRYRVLGEKKTLSGDEKGGRSQFQAGLEFARKAFDYYRLRAQLESGNSQLRRRLFIAHENLAADLLMLGNIEEAEPHIKASEEILREMYRTDGDNKETLLDELGHLKNRLRLDLLKKKRQDANLTAAKGLRLAQVYFNSNRNDFMGLEWVGFFCNQQMQVIRSLNGDTSRHEKMLASYRVEGNLRFGQELTFTGAGL